MRQLKSGEWTYRGKEHHASVWANDNGGQWLSIDNIDYFPVYPGQKPYPIGFPAHASSGNGLKAIEDCLQDSELSVEYYISQYGGQDIQILVQRT